MLRPTPCLYFWRTIMLVLSRRVQEGLVIGSDIAVKVLEIGADCVRLGIVPPAGKPIELHSESPGDEFDESIRQPEVAIEDGKQTVVVSGKVGRGIVINQSIQVRVVSVVEDKVRLGIVVPGNAPVHREEVSAALGRHSGAERGPSAPPAGPDRARRRLAAPANHGQGGSTDEASPPSPGSEAIPHGVFLDWIARQIEQYLDAHPEVTLQQLARAVGVSPATITRWRARQTNVARDHLQSLLDVLGTSLDDLARERNVKRVLPPEIKARGPAVRRRSL
jgi:carbon storage regulator CsrA